MLSSSGVPKRGGGKKHRDDARGDDVIAIISNRNGNIILLFVCSFVGRLHLDCLDWIVLYIAYRVGCLPCYLLTTHSGRCMYVELHGPHSVFYRWLLANGS